MVTPYVTTRTGSGQWIMQRVSAALLIGLAFTHFGIQHFTSDAVSTGLTVAARFNDPWWQGYYVAFILLALYHGINGVVGIVRDYRPRTVFRVVIEAALWSLAAFFAARGVINIAAPRPLSEVKALYAVNGFPKGDSPGSPPGISGVKHYDFQDQLRELHLFAYYLEQHTHRTESADLKTIFSGSGASEGGASFDRWLIDCMKNGAPAAGDRRREACFSSTYEFAVWAAHVRRTNAKTRGTQHDLEIVARFDSTALPKYDPNTQH
jgi:succinate dehydrogenase / fumarate reductase membrane anchor subunit